MVTEDTMTPVVVSNGKTTFVTMGSEFRWRRGCVTTGVELLQDFQADTATLRGDLGGWPREPRESRMRK